MRCRCSGSADRRRPRLRTNARSLPRPGFSSTGSEAFGGSLRGLYLASIGRLGESLAVQRWALEAARRSGDLSRRVPRARQHRRPSDPGGRPGAEESTLETLELTRRLGDRTGETFVLSNLWSGGCTPAVGRGRGRRAHGGRDRRRREHDLWSRARLMQLYLYRGQDERARAEARWCRSCVTSTTCSSVRSAWRPSPWSPGWTATSTGRRDGLIGASEAAGALGLIADATRLSWTMAAEAAVLGGRDDVWPSCWAWSRTGRPGTCHRSSRRRRPGTGRGCCCAAAASSTRPRRTPVRRGGHVRALLPVLAGPRGAGPRSALVADGRGDEAEKPARLAIETSRPSKRRRRWPRPSSCCTRYPPADPAGQSAPAANARSVLPREPNRALVLEVLTGKRLRYLA